MTPTMSMPIMIMITKIAQIKTSMLSLQVMLKKKIRKMMLMMMIVMKITIVLTTTIII